MNAYKVRILLLNLNSTFSNEYHEVQCISAHKKYVNAVAVIFSLKDYPNGLVVTGSNDQTICIHEIDTNELVAQLKDHDGAGKPKQTLY